MQRGQRCGTVPAEDARPISTYSALSSPPGLSSPSWQEAVRGHISACRVPNSLPGARSSSGLVAAHIWGAPSPSQGWRCPGWELRPAWPRSGVVLLTSAFLLPPAAPPCPRPCDPRPHKPWHPKERYGRGRLVGAAKKSLWGHGGMGARNGAVGWGGEQTLRWDLGFSWGQTPFVSQPPASPPAWGVSPPSRFGAERGSSCPSRCPHPIMGGKPRLGSCHQLPVPLRKPTVITPGAINHGSPLADEGMEASRWGNRGTARVCITPGGVLSPQSRAAGWERSHAGNFASACSAPAGIIFSCEVPDRLG